MALPLDAAPLAPPRARGASTRGPSARWWLLLGLAVLVTAYAVAYVAVGPPLMQTRLAERPWGIYPHALFGAAALLLGPFQFRGDLRRRRPGMHRRLGKAYLASCLVSGTAGIYMAAHSEGGWVTHLGFGALGAGMVLTTLLAYAAIRRGEVPRHRAWMVRSYALIFSAVTLRLELPLLVLAFGAFAPAYLVVSWLAWVPNLLWAEWYVRRPAARA